MAFPETPLGTLIEMQVGGTWTDITSDVLLRDVITHDRGRPDQGARTDPSKCTMTLNNLDGRYSPRNPLSPYYGLIGRNTPIRVSVPGPESYLQLDGSLVAAASTPDVAALDIVGDLDIRAEVTLDWDREGTQYIAYKWDSATSQRSYMLSTTTTRLTLNWSTNGTNSFFADCPLPSLPRRAAVRVTLDVDDGTGGFTARFYWAAALDGPWTLLGTASAAGITSIYSGSALLKMVGFEGRLHRLELRSGIGGTVVANPDLRSQASGAPAFTDGAGRLWSVVAPAEITNRNVRVVGEVSSWPPRWTASGKSAWVPITASGVLRRYGQGQKGLDSTLRRRIPSGSPSAYWPMEEEREAVQAYSPTAGVLPLRVSGVEFGAEDSLLGSAALPKAGPAASFSGRVPGSGTGWHVEMVYRLPTLPATQQEMLRVQVAGASMAWATVRVGTGGIRVEIRDADDTVTAFFNFTDTSNFAGVWNRLQLFTAVDGGSTYLAAGWLDVVTGAFSYSRTVYTGTPGRAVGVSASWGAWADGVSFGHLGVWNGVSPPWTPAAAAITIYNGADDGFQGESALDRMRRLAVEESIPLRTYDGDTLIASERLGPQRPAPMLTLLEECAAADGGVLHEDRERLGLRYRDRSSLYGQTPALVLDYTAGEVAPPLEPVEDDSRLRNDVTVTRSGGSAGRVVLETGPLSVQPPPAGVGLYDETVTLSLYKDEQAAQQAAWRLYLGTVDGVRVPSVHVQLHAAPQLVPAVLGLDVGDLVRIVNVPAWVGSGTLDLIVEGYQEEIGVRTWDVVFACSPGAPWTVGEVEDPVVGRADTDSSVVAAAVTSSATVLPVAVTAGPRWVQSAAGLPGSTPAELPVDVQVGGEVVRATAIEPWGWDSFGRSVAASWGTATSGRAWTETGGVAADRSVDGSRGVVTLTANPTTVRFQTTDGAVGDAEVRVRMSASAVATGASMIPAVLLRYVNGSTYYRARLHFGTAGAMFLSVSRDTTQVGSAPTLPWTYTAGDEFEVRVTLTGHTISMRVWPVGTEEPVGWHLTETIMADTIAAGAIGLTASAFAGTTNVAPQLRFDQFEITNPQRFTVARSINGIAKAHQAGSDVRLAQPSITAL
ncbi:hypothetical protein [Streptomyces sp. NPDC048442]|uniref:hypothetical protein n=1 Tax=Streptomyces sp. NPDC048442 TaxID=3154823 RepID=UPI00342D78D8